MIGAACFILLSLMTLCCLNEAIQSLMLATGRIYLVLLLFWYIVAETDLSSEFHRHPYYYLYQFLIHLSLRFLFDGYISGLGEM